MLFLQEASGLLIPLFTALIAAAVALKIASLNAQRTTERNTIAELRLAYAIWNDAINDMVKLKRLDDAYEHLSWQRDPTLENLTKDAEQHVYSTMTAAQAASRIRILDAALPPEFDKIIGVLITRKWDDELGECSWDSDPYIDASRCVDQLMERVAKRLISKNPFRIPVSDLKTFDLVIDDNLNP